MTGTNCVQFFFFQIFSGAVPPLKNHTLKNMDSHNLFTYRFPIGLCALLKSCCLI